MSGWRRMGLMAERWPSAAMPPDAGVIHLMCCLTRGLI